MKTKDEYTYGVTQETIDYGFWGKTYDLRNGIRSRQTVTPGLSVTGDFKTPNPWSFSIREEFMPVGHLEVGSNMHDEFNKTHVVRTGLIGTGQNHNIVAEFSLSDSYNDALSKLNEQVRGGLDLSVAMAESGSTVRMIRALAKWNRWFRGFGAKRWANEWLQYTYGWVPLLSDIYKAVEEVTREADSKLVFQVTGKSALTVAETFLYGYTGPIWYTPKIHDGKCGTKLLVKMRTPRSNTDIARWTSLNPISIAWELIPYSFVVDWFVDIGGYLRDFETALMYRSAFEHGYMRQLVAYRLEHTYQEQAYTSTSIVNVRSTSSVKHVQFYRSLLGGYPIPLAPVIKTDLSWRRLVSAGALLAQKLLR